MNKTAPEFLIDVALFCSHQYGMMEAYYDCRREVGGLLSLWAYAANRSAQILKAQHYGTTLHDLIENIYIYVKDSHETELRTYSEDPETWEFDKYDLQDLASLKQDLDSLIKRWG